MRRSRVFRLIVRLFLLVLTLSVSLISFLGGLSAFLILSDVEENFNIDLDNIEGNFTITASESMYVEIPIRFKNVGYFDLEDLTIELTIYMTYGDNSSNNASTTIEIFNKIQEFDTIPSGKNYKDKYKGESEDFNSDDFNDIKKDITISPDFPINYTGDIFVRCKYSLGFLGLRVELLDFPLEGLI